jgi:hypothetical protein
MSRAFIKEDVELPEAEKIYEFRAFWGLRFVLKDLKDDTC